MGDVLVTVKEIAEKSGLSAASVSRVLRNDRTFSISADTRMRVLLTAEKMGYVKKAAKKPKNATEKRKTKKVIIFINRPNLGPSIDISYHFAIRTGIEDTCHNMGWKYSFADAEEAKKWKNNEHAHGALVVGNYSKAVFSEIIKKLDRIPVTSIGVISYFPGKIDHITHSNNEAVDIALEYLFENGHRQIGYLGVKEITEMELFGSRKQRFISVMKEKNLFNPVWVYECSPGQNKVERGYQMMQKWIGKKQALPTAIFCANDPVAIGAVNALREANISTPEDISILSHDGSFPAEYSFPALTTVDVHPYQLGVEGVKLLRERLTEGRKIAKTVFLHPELIIRDSVKNISPD
jgi:LacI family transcriptional regulator